MPYYYVIRAPPNGSVGFQCRCQAPLLLQLLCCTTLSLPSNMDTGTSLLRVRRLPPAAELQWPISLINPLEPIPTCAQSNSHSIYSSQRAVTGGIIVMSLDYYYEYI